MRQWITIVLVVGMVGGCSRPQRVQQNMPPAAEVDLFRRTLVQVQVITTPPGAHISVNNDYIGVSPCEITLEQNYGGNLASTYNIEALPNQPGQYVQRRILLIGTTMVHRLYFEMSMHQEPKSIDVNVK